MRGDDGGRGAGWLRRFGPARADAMRLFCFHYAGGSAAMFRDWPARAPHAEVLAVQLPGRENRFCEPAYDAMAPLAGDVADALAGFAGRPYAFFGFSMGARVALAVAHLLRDRGLGQPAEIFVASSCAPGLEMPVRGWDEPDEALVAYLRELGGTPPEVLEQPALLELYLPMIRADLTVIGTCPALAGPPLAVPIRAFAGVSDTQAPPELMRDWRRETTARFELDVVSGGHFFDPAGTAAMLRLIAKDLDQEGEPHQFGEDH